MVSSLNAHGSSKARDLCTAALASFDADGPVQYALRTSTRRILERASLVQGETSCLTFSNAEWFAIAEALFVTRVQLLHVHKILESAAYEVVPADQPVSADTSTEKREGKRAPAGTTPATKFDWAFSSQLIMRTRSCLMLVETALERYIVERTDTATMAGNLAPRWQRLMHELKFTSKEERLMQHLLHRATLQEDVSEFSTRSKNGSPSPAAYAGMTTLEIAEFLRPSRRHVVDGLIPDMSKAMFKSSSSYGDEFPYVSTSSSMGFNSGSLQLPGEVIKACCGESLSEEDVLKLDKTAMLEVLKVEPGFKSSHQQETHGTAKVANPQEPMATLKADGDLFELIKLEVQRDASARKRKSADVSDDPPAKKSKLSLTQQDADKGDTGAEAPDSKAAKTSQANSETNSMPPAADTVANRVAALPSGESADVAAESPGEIRAYRTDLEFLEDHFKLLISILRIAKLKRVLALDENDQNGMEDEGMFYERTARPSARSRIAQQLRELQGKERIERSRIDRRLQITAESDNGNGPPWQPRLERLATARALSAFEKNMLLLLVGYHVAPSVQRAFEASRSGAYSTGSITVGSILLAFMPDSLKEQIAARKYFYKSARMIKDGIVSLTGTDFSKDIMDQVVDADRRMLDFLVGLDTEFSDLVDGSHLYYPGHTYLKDVVLPAEQKDLIADTVKNFAAYKKVRKMLQDDESSTTSGGVVLLFHGQSGVGKTMMANALAHEVHKKVLLINFPSLGVNAAGDVIRFIFREAKIHDALLFFDECESIFEDRELRGSHHVNLLLTEVERHDGVIIMATNRPHDLDEAMHRRITMQFEFRKPDHMQRQMIWRRLLPSKVKLDADVDITVLALKYELSGGYIRNAVQAALSRATSRLGNDKQAEDVSLSQEDLLHGAKLQLRGALRMKDFDRRRVPTRGMDDVLLADQLKAKLDKVVKHEKARAVLMGQWGFGAKGELVGTTCLFHGPPGTGKTLAAEAIGFETGKPLKVVNCSGIVSKYVGDTSKSLDALFQEARAIDAVLVFDEAESLFGARGSSMESSTDRYAAMDVGILLHHLENHIGIVVLITNKPSSLDSAFQRRIRFQLEFEMPPPALRAKLWRAMIPSQAPVAKDVDWEHLGRGYELAGGSIKNAVVRAATRAALRMSSDDKDETTITMADLRDEAAEEASKGNETAHLSMFT